MVAWGVRVAEAGVSADLPFAVSVACEVEARADRALGVAADEDGSGVSVDLGGEGMCSGVCAGGHRHVQWSGGRSVLGGVVDVPESDSGAGEGCAERLGWCASGVGAGPGAVTPEQRGHDGFTSM